MGTKDTSHGRRFSPLNQEEVEQYLRAAKESEDTLTELTARTLVYTGLRAGEFAHLQQRWLTDDRTDSLPMLNVPEKELCIGGAGTIGHGDHEDESQQDFTTACYRCRTRRDGQWEPEANHAIRKIPIAEEGVYKRLEDWFAVHHQIPLDPSAVTDRVQRVAERAGLSREGMPRDLRHTYETILARRGIDARTIASVMGYSRMRRVTEPLTFIDTRQEFEDSREDDDPAGSDDSNSDTA